MRCRAGSGTVSLRATVPNADHHFWPGQFVTVRLILATQKNAVLIPSQATQISQQGPYVFVIKPDDTAELRQVTLGLRQGRRRSRHARGNGGRARGVGGPIDAGARRESANSAGRARCPATWTATGI